MGAGGASKKKGENREKSKMMPFELRVTDLVLLPNRYI